MAMMPKQQTCRHCQHMKHGEKQAYCGFVASNCGPKVPHYVTGATVVFTNIPLWCGRRDDVVFKSSSPLPSWAHEKQEF